MFEDILDVNDTLEDEFTNNNKIVCRKCGVTIVEVIVNEEAHVDVRDYEFDCRQCSEEEL